MSSLPLALTPPDKLAAAPSSAPPRGFAGHRDAAFGAKPPASGAGDSAPAAAGKGHKDGIAAAATPQEAARGAPGAPADAAPPSPAAPSFAQTLARKIALHDSRAEAAEELPAPADSASAARAVPSVALAVDALAPPGEAAERNLAADQAVAALATAAMTMRENAGLASRAETPPEGDAGGMPLSPMPLAAAAALAAEDQAAGNRLAALPKAQAPGLSPAAPEGEAATAGARAEQRNERDAAASFGIALTGTQPASGADASPGTPPAISAAGLPEAALQAATIGHSGKGTGRAKEASAAAATAPAAAAAPPVSGGPAAARSPVLPLAAAAGSSQWRHELADKLTWMAGQGHQHAELVLNPPQLGRIEVSLSLTGDQASAAFAAPNPAARELLEAALPRLREMLAEAGVFLGQTHVGSEASGRAGEGRYAGDDHGGRAPGGEQAQGVTAGGNTAWLPRGEGLVDIFA